jgi:hypothetical protein
MRSLPLVTLTLSPLLLLPVAACASPRPSGSAVAYSAPLTGASAQPQRTRGVVLQMRHAPYVAVRCPGSGTISCDRVGIAAWPQGHPLSLTVTIARRRIVMRSPASSSSGGYWQGTLKHAGLLRRGPLHITPDSGRSTWMGRHPRPVTIRLTASYAGVPDASVVVRLLLRPGWG